MLDPTPEVRNNVYPVDPERPKRLSAQAQVWIYNRVVQTVAQSMLSGESPKVTIRIVAVEEGGFTAICPEIPGCVSEGETREQAEQNIRKAIDGCLSVIFEDLLRRIKPAIESASEAGPAAMLETVAISLPRLVLEAA